MNDDGPDQYTPEQRAALEGTPHTPTQLNQPAAQYGPTHTGGPPGRVQPVDQWAAASAVTQPTGSHRAPTPPRNPWRFLPLAAVGILLLMALGGFIGVNYYAPVQHTVSDVFRNNAATKTQLAETAVIPARSQAPFAARVVVRPVMVTATATVKTTATATATDKTTTNTTTTATATATAPPVTTTQTQTSTVTAPGTTTTVTVTAPPPPPCTNCTTTVTPPPPPPVTVTAPPVTVTATATDTVTLPPGSSS